MKTIYFDNNATTKVAEEVAEEMKPFFCNLYGNPSSMHGFGREAKKRVEDAVNQVMQDKGYKLVEGEDFDFVIMTHAGSKERMQVHNTGVSAAYGGYGGWYDPWWGPYGGTTHVSYYEESTLVLDIVHWEKKELAWRGLATGTVREDNKGGKQQAEINNIVAKMLANFPPPEKE